MAKVQMGPSTMIYPMPAVIVGANVDGKANFMTVAWSGVADGDPAMVSVAIRHSRYTHKGIQQNLTYSINVPSTDLVKQTDYCGITSGSKVNKNDVCKFKIFYGKLATAPLIEECPVNLECKVVHILDLGSHSLIIGKVEETHVSDSCLTDGKPDVDKIKPLIYVGGPNSQYRAFGTAVGKAFAVGREIAPKPQ